MTRAKGPTYEVVYRRRREGKTNYRKRLALIKSGKPRMVVRRSNRNVTVQFVEFQPKGDNTKVTVTGKHLQKLFGWPSKRNVWTAYLAGLYAGKLAQKGGVNDFVLDMGMYVSTKGNIVFAALKGAVEAGLKSSMDEGVVPSEKLSNLPEALKQQFEDAKNKIMKG